MVNNAVTGAASLFRRELLDVALPFPPRGPAEHYHDHWLALCALAHGRARLPRPADLRLHAPRRVGDPAGGAPWTAPPRDLGDRVRDALAPLDPPAADGDDAARLARRLLRPLPADPPARRPCSSCALGERIEPPPSAATSTAWRPPSARRARAAWLLGRALRPLIGPQRDARAERVLLGALLWRRAGGAPARGAGARSRPRPPPGRPARPRPPSRRARRGWPT